MRSRVTLALGLTFTGTALAQPVPLPELSNRLVNVPTHITVGASTVGLLFTHRFVQTIEDGGGEELLGLDGSADIGIGLEVGFGKAWQVELYRSSAYKTYEAAVKWTALRQGSVSPLGLAVRLGTDYRGASGIDERWSGFVQAVVSRRLGDRLDVFLVPMVSTDTPTLRNATNVAFGGAFHLPRGWDLAAEVVAENGDTPEGSAAWSVAVNKRVPGHSFLVYLGNSPATTVDLLVGSDYPGGFRTGDVRLGFNIVRRFPE
ncbi:MAG: DUF5777 family beta-barrel protein [Acidobacteriota bacterium]